MELSEVLRYIDNWLGEILYDIAKSNIDYEGDSHIWMLIEDKVKPKIERKFWADISKSIYTITYSHDWSLEELRKHVRSSLEELRKLSIDIKDEANFQEMHETL